MKKFLVFLIWICLGQYCSYAWLDDLSDLYKGPYIPEIWTLVYTRTVNDINDYLVAKKCCLSNMKKVALWAFLTNKNCLERFLASDLFTKDKDGIYNSWLKNIFRLECKAAVELDNNFQAERYNKFISDNQSVKELIKVRDFNTLSDEIEQILERNIDWGD